MNHSITRKPRKWPILTVIVVAVVAVGLIVLLPNRGEDDLTPITIGWQVAWATQGQLAQTLAHTDILERNGLRGELVGFTYGAPLNEAALAGEIDVGFAADQPAVSLVARGGEFRIVARLIDFRAALIVPPESDVLTVADLRGKTVAMPFGSTTHRIALGMLRKAGLEPGTDVRVINMDIAEQPAVVAAGSRRQWRGGIDGLASWDPNVAIFEDRGLARVVEFDVGLSVVYMSSEFIEEHPDKAVAFLQAYVEAYYYYATHQDQANQWFVEEARIEFDPSLLDIAASFEQNTRARELAAIDVVIHDRHVEMMQAGADFAFDLGLIARKPDMRAVTDTSLLMRAQRRLQEQSKDISRVRAR